MMTHDASNTTDESLRPMRLVGGGEAPRRMAHSTGTNGAAVPADPPRWDVKVQILPSVGDGRDAFEAWDELAVEAGASISMTPAWCDVWMRHYGDECESRLCLIWQSDRLLSALPFIISPVRLGPVTIKLARLMGLEENPHACSPAMAEDVTPAMMAKALAALLEDERCDAVRLASQASTSRLPGLCRAALASQLINAKIVRDQQTCEHTTLELPNTYDDYLSGLSRNMRASIRKGIRRLESEEHLTEDLITNPLDAIAAYHRFVEMHRAQWSVQGRLGHFDDWPNAELFNRSLVAALSQQGRAWMHELVIDRGVIARQYAFVHGRTAHCRLAARDLDERWRSCNLGAVSLAMLFRRLIEAGVRQVDLGLGEYEYKSRLGGETHPLSTMLIARDSRDSLRRVRRFSRLANVYDQLYYRQWFCRLRPRLGLPGRPLAWSWIRSRP